MYFFIYSVCLFPFAKFFFFFHFCGATTYVGEIKLYIYIVGYDYISRAVMGVMADVKPVTDCVGVGDILVWHSPHVQSHSDQSPLTTSSSSGGHLLIGLVHSSQASLVKRNCPSRLSVSLVSK